MEHSEFAVIGGGLVGMAIAHGLLRLGRQVTVLDEGDDAYRASRGNFGLVWVQGKGAALPDYARWTRESASLWPDLAADLQERTGISVELSQPGGIDYFLSDEEAEQAVARLSGLRADLGGEYPFEYLGRNALKDMVPHIGPKVVGGLYGPEDGHVNPLHLLRALYSAVTSAGGRVLGGAGVRRIEYTGETFRIEGREVRRANNVVLCAGLGNAALAPMVGLQAPVRPQRGQVIVSERVRPFLHYPSSRVRQVGEGGVQLGDSQEEVGLDDGTTSEVVAGIARRAVQVFPLLGDVRMVRSWAALRVMSPDGHPIYDRSQQCPGAFLVTCHSGVTLAASHALRLAGWIAEGRDTRYVESFSARRFDVQAAG